MLNNNQKKIIEKIIAYIKKRLSNESTGHDFYHSLRVYYIASYLAKKEKNQVKNLNFLIIATAALLHDLTDWKFTDEKDFKKQDEVKNLLSSFQFNKKTIEKIIQIIKDISFKGAGVYHRPKTSEEKIVQDADRLDALGAIGIARTFAYGGFYRKPIFDPNIFPKKHFSFADYKKNRHSTTINHFYEKLLILNTRLNTKTAQKIASRKVKFMKKFLKEFYFEWWQFNNKDKEKFLQSLPT